MKITRYRDRSSQRSLDEGRRRMRRDSLKITKENGYGQCKEEVPIATGDDGVP